MEPLRNLLSCPAEKLRGLSRCQSRGWRRRAGRGGGGVEVGRWASVARWLIGGGKEVGSLESPAGA